MKFLIIIYSFIFLNALSGCESNTENSRAYAEGKIRGTQVEFSKISVKIRSSDITIAETVPDGSGKFVLSGPLVSNEFSIVINRKIKSFSASKSGCVLSADSFSVQAPAGTTYIIFNEIVLE